MEKKKKFYVTTPIYYVTAQPHLGSLYSTLLADFAARWHKIKDEKTFFLTGTDEHGQKVLQAAEKAGKLPQEFVDSFISDYKRMWQDYEIEYNYFIRTTDESHKKAVQQWIKRLQEKGDIYKSFYTGFYCTPCETYITEKESTKENEKPICTSCGRDTTYVSEESYFFKLSAYQDLLLKFYKENPDFITPPERMLEVVNFVKKGLKDLSISRTTVKWGIPFLDDSTHVTYVWADALNNYITAIGYSDPNRKEEFEFWWPADLQIIGKDILRFHAVYWPAFLMASDLELPKKLLVHGWILVNRQKMSKSLGNIINPQTLLDTYGADAVRYYLARYMAITQDSEFNVLDLEQKISSDLANELGNLLQRMVSLSFKKELFQVNPPNKWGAKEIELRDNFWSVLELVIFEMDEGYFYRALNSIWKYIGQVNAYFHAQEPWKISNKDEFEQIISATCHSLYCISILLWPIMPKKMEELLESLGKKFEFDQDYIKNLSENPWNFIFALKQIPLLFKKYEVEELELNSKSESKENSYKMISIEDFSKVVLLVGTIKKCEEIAGSEKLLKLQVDFGFFYGTKQIVSGIKKYFSCSDLTDKQAIFVYNLVPRKIMGMESQGMILTASKDDSLTLISPDMPMPNGTKLK